MERNVDRIFLIAFVVSAVSDSLSGRDLVKRPRVIHTIVIRLDHDSYAWLISWATRLKSSVRKGYCFFVCLILGNEESCYDEYQ